MSHAGTPPEHVDVVDRAKGLMTAVRAAADTVEQQRRITPEILAQLRDAGLFRMCVPRSVGGLEERPDKLLRVVEELATADAATAWSVMIGATSAITSGYLAPAVARQVYGDPSAISVGPFAPLGKATPEDGGFRLTGRWPFVSMCQDATWIMGGGVADAGRRLLFLFPAEQGTVHDTWKVMGLRGTGSHDVEVDGQWIPSEFTVPLQFDQPVEAGTLYRFPVLGLLSAAIASVALGAARGAVEDIIDLAGVKTPTYGVRKLQERPMVQLQISQALAEVEAARASLREGVAVAWTNAASGDEVGLPARAALRRAAVHAAGAAARAVDLMYTVGGGTSLYERSPLQRRFRDVHAATQHVMVGQGVMETAGRALLGLRVEPGQL
ncbi:acyl-CoA dehydrogenase family protein [Symbioplanes lichenis]|uniref:acyl-CoA dehydrogenase family protein n=1 Tax=Symbioplanes lichenis TaxID=1629072 RepID=UPI0027395861|nr:acyl-CoA dehydrogenase family protein [Actinoplanes lichenis]